MYQEKRAAAVTVQVHGRRMLARNELLSRRVAHDKRVALENHSAKLIQVGTRTGVVLREILRVGVGRAADRHFVTMEGHVLGGWAGLPAW